MSSQCFLVLIVRDISLTSLQLPVIVNNYSGYCDINLLGPHDALKHHFTLLKTDLIFLQPRVSERKLP